MERRYSFCQEALIPVVSQAIQGYNFMKSFDSNDKSFEERFDPELRTIGDSQLQNHDQKKGQTPTSKFFG